MGPSCFSLENILCIGTVRCYGRDNQSHSSLVYLGAGVPRDGESEPWQEQLLRPQDTLLHLMSPDTGVPESLPAYSPVSKKEHHATVACNGGRAFSHRKEGKEGRQEEEEEPEGPWLTLFLCPPPLTAASQTKCAQQKVFEAQ